MKLDNSVTKPSPKAIPFMDCFWSLAEEECSLRARAGQDLVMHCFSSNDNTLNIKDASYALRRLLDGVSSGRACARQGFASCLTSFLHVAYFGTGSSNSIELILQELTQDVASSSVHHCLHGMLIKSTTPTAASINGSSDIKGKPSEVRDCAFGRLFGISAILRSGMLKDAPLPILEEYLEEIVDLYKFRKWTREISCHGIIDFLQAYRGDDSTWKTLTFKIVIPKLLQLDNKNIDDGGIVKDANQEELASAEDDSDLLINWTADQIAVALYVQRSLTPTKTDELLVPSWLKKPLITDANLDLFSISLLDTSLTYPRRHLIWSQLLQNLFPIDCNTAELVVPPSQNKNSSVHALFNIVVEPQMATSTHHRKALALELMHDFVQALPDKEMSMAMPPDLRNLFLNTLTAPVHNKKKQQQHMLKPLGQKILNSLVTTACKDSTALFRRVETAKLLFEMDPRFDSRTNTNSASSLLLDENVTFSAEHLHNFVDFLEIKILSAAKEVSAAKEKSQDKEEDEDPDVKDSERRMELHVFDGFLELLCRTTIQMSLKLSHAEREDLFQRILAFLMTFAFFDCRKLSLPSNKIKKKKKSKAVEAAVVIHAAVAVGLRYKDDCDMLLPYEYRASVSARFFSLLADYASVVVVRPKNSNASALQQGEDDSPAEELNLKRLETLERATTGWAALEENGAKLIRSEFDVDSANTRTVAGDISKFVKSSFMMPSSKTGDGKLFSLRKRCATSFATLAVALQLQQLRCGAESDSDHLPEDDEDDFDDDLNDAIPAIWEVCQRLVQKDVFAKMDLKMDEEDLSKTMFTLVELLTDIIGIKSDSKSRGASLRLLRDVTKNVWSSSLTLLAHSASSRSEFLSLDLDDTVSHLLESICGEDQAQKDTDLTEDSDEEEEIEQNDGEELFTSEAAFKAFGEDDSDSPDEEQVGQQSNSLDDDDDEDELMVDSSQLESLLLQSSDEEQELEHHEGADAALARLIKLKQESRKNAHRERERAAIAHQIRCIALLETLFSSKYTVLLRGETVFSSILPLLKARRELEKSLSLMTDAGKGGFSEKRALLERITSVLKTKICKMKLDKNPVDSVVSTAELLLEEAQKSPNVSHCASCSAGFMFMLKSTTDEASRETIGSLLNRALVEWSTKKSSKLHLILFEDAISRFPVFAATSIGVGLSVAAASGRSDFIMTESFRLLSLLYDTKDANAVSPLKSVMAASVQSAISALSKDGPMWKSKRCRDLLKSIESMISFALLNIADRNTWELFDALSPLLIALGEETNSDGVKKICAKLVSNIAAGVLTIQEQKVQETALVENAKSKKKSKKSSKK